MVEVSSAIAPLIPLVPMITTRIPLQTGLPRFAHRFRAGLAMVCSSILAAAPLLNAQELRLQPTPFSVTLDFQHPATKPSYPIWLESVEKTVSRDPVSQPGFPGSSDSQKTVQRLRLRRLGQLNSEIQLRLFFDDLPGCAPKVTGYTETGRLLYSAPALGAGLRLPTSESLCIPVLELDYLEISVPGDGSTLRGAFLCTLAKAQVRHALDFEAPARLQDPYGNAAGRAAPENDAYLSGRVRATLSELPTPCSAGAPALFEFTLETIPHMAVFRFEVLGVDPIHTPVLTLNHSTPAKPALQLPDLADPAYVCRHLPTVPHPRLQYMGWIPAQYAVAGSDLKTGLNQLWIQVPAGALPAAIRTLTLDLKYPAPQFQPPTEP